MSRGFGRQNDGEKVIVVNLGYFSTYSKIQLFYHTRQISGFPCGTLYINSEVAVMIGHYIIYFENSLVSILILFYLINLVIFEKLIWPKLKSVLLISLSENITVTVERCYIKIAVTKILDTFW